MSCATGNVTYTGFLPNFKAAQRKNLDYQNVYGQNKDPHDPGWEIGGDKAAIARQSYSTPEIYQTFKNVRVFGQHGVIQGATGRNGYSPQKIMELRGTDWWKYRKNLDIDRQMTLTQLRVNKEMQLKENSFADPPKIVYLLLILTGIFVFAFVINNSDQ